MLIINRLINLDYRGIFFTVLDRNRRKYNILLFSHIFRFFCWLKGVKMGKRVIFNGNPIIHRHHNSTITIGSGCLLNSAKNSIIIGLNRPCSFVTFFNESEISIGKDCGFSGLTVASVKKVSIGNNVIIGANCTIADTDFHHTDPQKRRQYNDVPSKPIVIEDNVFIGFNCFILKGVTIGRNSVIGANSVVLNDIPENSIAIGNPCKVIMRKNWS